MRVLQELELGAFAVGDRVRVLSGRFSGCVGTVLGARFGELLVSLDGIGGALWVQRVERGAGEGSCSGET